MPYSDPKRQKAYNRSPKRLAYFRQYSRKRRLLKPYHGNSLAYKAEELGLKILIGSRKISRPCDINWEGKLVDVKTGIKHDSNHWTTRGKNTTYRWKFFLKQLRKIDLFLIICQNRDNKVEHIFLIPDKMLKTKHLSISENRIDKYSQYRLSPL